MLAALKPHDIMRPNEASRIQAKARAQYEGRAIQLTPF